ncbi:MAG: type III-B CRISPR module RAMP protein Cmr6 [Thermofilaceae archaeon]
MSGFGQSFRERRERQEGQVGKIVEDQSSGRESFAGVSRLLDGVPQLEKTTNLYSYVILMGTGILLEKKLSAAGNEDSVAGNENKDKRELLKRMCIWLPVNEKPGTHTLYFPHVQEHLNSVQKGLLTNGYQLKLCKIESIERGLVSAGGAFGKVPFEVGLAFDPVFNVPYIPASSLKGAFRQALELKWDKDMAELIFGGKNEAGLIGVTDAYPVQIKVEDQRGGVPRLFEPDVLTPHYPGKEVEINVQPNPVVFATIAPGVVFEFYVYYNRELRRGKVEVSDVFGSAKHIYEGDLAAVNFAGKSIKDLPAVDLTIVYALTRGIGAKSSLGYSRFKLLEYRKVS